MTLSRDRNGASGSRLLLSSIAGAGALRPPVPGLMPLPMNSAAKRFGVGRGGIPFGESGNDSSHGRAIVTPRPRRRVRRERVRLFSITAAGFEVHILWVHGQSTNVTITPG